MNGADTATADVRSCARCGGDHDSLEFRALAEPAGDDTHWAPCPATGEPVMMRIEQMSALASILADAAARLSAAVEEAAAPLEEAGRLDILDDAGWELARRQGESRADEVVRLLGSYIVNSRTQPDWTAPSGGSR